MPTRQGRDHSPSFQRCQKCPDKVDEHNRIRSIMGAGASLRNGTKSPDPTSNRLPRACQPKRPSGAARGKHKGIDGTGFVVDEGVTGCKKTAGVHMDPDIQQRRRLMTPLVIDGSWPSHMAVSRRLMGKTREGHAITHTGKRRRGWKRRTRFRHPRSVPFFLFRELFQRIGWLDVIRVFVDELYQRSPVGLAVIRGRPPLIS
jgi:hypothetical protein